MNVRQFAHGCEVAQALLVRDAELKRRRDGREFLKLLLGDRTGSVVGVMREGIDAARSVCGVGEVVFVSGR